MPRKPMNVQTLIFDKGKFSKSSAKRWASQHDFTDNGIDETEDSLRMRQKEPGQFKKFRTITLTEGVKAVVAKAMLDPGDSYNQYVHGEGEMGGTVKDGSDDERFLFGKLTFDIHKARQMGGSEANAEVPVSDKWLDKVKVDGNAAMDGGSEKPVFIAQLHTDDGVKPLLIDGNHRMYKAVKEGKKTLPAHVFTPEETLSLLQKDTAEKSQPGSSSVHVNAPLGSEEDKVQKDPEDGLGFEQLARAKAADLVTFPDDVNGAVCDNCKWVNGDFCTNPDVDQELKDGADRMCCSLWDREGTVRVWESEQDVNKDDADIIHQPLNNTDVEVEQKALVRGDQQLGGNDMVGLYDMQNVVSGIDYEMAHGTTDYDMAKELALSNLEDDPNHYRKKWLEADTSTDDSLAMKDTEQENPQEGFSIDLGSGDCREPGHLGFDLYPYDHGTIIHDLNLGIPLSDQSVKRACMKNALHTFDEKDQKPLLSEIQRVLMPGGQFVYEGPNELYNYPDWLVMTQYEDNLDDLDSAGVEKVEGNPIFRQAFTRIAVPDAATADDSEPRIGIAQYDMLPADALLAMDALGYYWSDSTSSGRGNRLHGYPSQGALVKRQKPLEDDDDDEETQEDVDKADLTTEGRKRIAGSNFALPKERKYPIHDISHARNALARSSGKPEEGKVRAAVYRKYPSLKDSAKKAVKKFAPIFKADLHKQIVYGVVLAPDEVDAQDDWMTADDIEKAAHSYLSKSRVVGSGHTKPIDAEPVESYVAPHDFESDGQYGPSTVKKGSWILGVKIHDPKEWQKVLEGDYTGFSVGGFGLRT